MNTEIRGAREQGICPRCKSGNGRAWDGAGSRTACYSCRGFGTWEAYRLHREFVKGWNAALENVKQRLVFAPKDMP